MVINQIFEMIVFVEPDCNACMRVLEIARTMHKSRLINRLIIINSAENPEACGKYGVLIYPAVFIDGELTFYGEFTIEDALKYAKNKTKIKQGERYV